MVPSIFHLSHMKRDNHCIFLFYKEILLKFSFITCSKKARSVTWFFYQPVSNHIFLGLIYKKNSQFYVTFCGQNSKVTHTVYYVFEISMVKFTFWQSIRIYNRWVIHLTPMFWKYLKQTNFFSKPCIDATIVKMKNRGISKSIL